jgi:hypothetical protein
MKHHQLFKILAIYFLFNLISCTKPPCKCDFTPAQFIEVKIVNDQGENLIFGPASLYKIDSIKVLKQKNNPNVNNASVNKGAIDSTNLRLDFYMPEEKSYIYYNQQSLPDSIEIKWLNKIGKCCDAEQEYYTVDSVKFNGVLIKPENGVYQLVK